MPGNIYDIIYRLSNHNYCIYESEVQTPPPPPPTNADGSQADTTRRAHGRALLLAILTNGTVLAHSWRVEEAACWARTSGVTMVSVSIIKSNGL